MGEGGTAPKSDAAKKDAIKQQNVNTTTNTIF